jgi:hypothetical protein
MECTLSGGRDSVSLRHTSLQPQTIQTLTLLQNKVFALRAFSSIEVHFLIFVGLSIFGLL